MARDRRGLDLEYSPSSVARDPDRALRRYRRLGDEARRRLDVHEHLDYGSGPGEQCHVFPAATRPGDRAPVLVFVHGGHWQESGIDDACFTAGHAVASGYAFVAVGYGLAPRQSLPGMIDSVARALTWVADAGPGYGIDPRALHVAGSSAGAHLLSCALTRPGSPRASSACLLSGLYDLSEIPGTYVNQALGLSQRLAQDCSPLGMAAPKCDRILLAVGEHETRTYLRQQHQYAAHLTAAGVAVDTRVVPDRDHFDLPLDLADPATWFGRDSLSHLGLPVQPDPDTRQGPARFAT